MHKDEEPLLQGLVGRPVVDLGSEGSVVAEATGGHTWLMGSPDPDIVGK